MFECLIMGDSTGLGTARAISARYSGHCDVVAAERATTAQIMSWRRPEKAYGTTILAIGSNDTPDAGLTGRLSRIRTNILSRRVIWLLPYSRPRAYIVRAVAISFGDEAIDLVRFQSKDNIHPRHYDDIASALLKRPWHREKPF